MGLERREREVGEKRGQKEEEAKRVHGRTVRVTGNYMLWKGSPGAGEVQGRGGVRRAERSQDASKDPVAGTGDAEGV